MAALPVTKHYLLFITLYILNYNYGHFIDDAIKSALDQDYKDYEIIIIDDGSTDGSLEKINAWLKQPKIRVIQQKNSGLMRSINRAWQEAKGTYVMRLDADDTLTHTALSTLADYAVEYPDANWIFPGFFTCNQHLKAFKKEHRSEDVFYIEPTDPPPHGACSLIKRETLKKINGYDEGVACRDGLDLFLKLKDTNSILSVPDYLFSYRRHHNNLTLNREMIAKSEQELKLKQSHAFVTCKNIT